MSKGEFMSFVAKRPGNKRSDWCLMKQERRSVEGQSPAPTGPIP